MTDTKTPFSDQAEERLEALRKRFQEMELEQMRKGEMEARAKLAKAKKTVDRKRDEAREMLKRARKAGASAAAEIQEGLDAALTELSDAVERARRDFEGIVDDEEEEKQSA